MSDPGLEMIVIGAIGPKPKTFNQIAKITKIPPDELNAILESLESKGLIFVQEKKGFLGKKIEIHATDDGKKRLEERITQLGQSWQQLTQLYKSKDKKKLKEYLDKNKLSFREMMFFGVLDIMMFSMMFSLIGASMTDFIPSDQMPADFDGGEGADGAGDFDIDIGF